MNYFEVRTCAERVDEGVRLLDAYGPADWREQTHRHALNVASYTQCPLGQVYGHYGTGINTLQAASHGLLDGKPWNARNCGFAFNDEPFENHRLNKAWRARITRDLAARATNARVDTDLAVAGD